MPLHRTVTGPANHSIKDCGWIIRGLLLTTVFLAGCQPSANEPVTASGETATRIVSLAPHITELVYAAGAGERLVGVVDYSDYPFEARSVPRVGDSFRVDYETVSALNPDMIISWQSGNPVELIGRLRELGYRIVELEPARLDDIATHIVTIGELAGTQAAAGQSAGRFREQLASLRTKYAGAPELRVFFQISADPFFTITGRHIISEAIDLCGGRNVFADIAGLAPSVTLEAILAVNPEVIIAAVAATDESWRPGWENWQTVSAVAAGNLYGVNRDVISRSGPRFIEGVRQICDALDRARSKT